jgi:hypothetical protein
MSEAEKFRASQEARADVVSGAGRSGTHVDPVRHIVEAALYRETHRAEPAPSTDEDLDDAAEA